MAEDMLVPAALPMRPGEYLRRRRLLAGQTIAQAARPHWFRPDHQVFVENNWRTFERPDVTLELYLVESLRKSFDLDVDTYRQLTEPSTSHPTLCRCCASSDMEPRTTRDGFSARIADDGICTACHEDAARRGRMAA